eukprot:tig00000403_g260.t1
MDDEFLRFQQEMAALESGGAADDAQASQEVAEVNSQSQSPAPIPAAASSSSAPGVKRSASELESTSPAPRAKVQKQTISAAPVRFTPGEQAQQEQGFGYDQGDSSSGVPPSMSPEEWALEKAKQEKIAADAQAMAARRQSAKQKAGADVAYLRKTAGVAWVDPTLADWPENDYRAFVGNLGNDVTDTILAQAFSRYPSFQKARTIKTYQGKGKYGFVSFWDPKDFLAAMREMNGKFIGTRPVQMKKSNWADRNLKVVPAPPPKEKKAPVPKQRVPDAVWNARNEGGGKLQMLLQRALNGDRDAMGGGASFGRTDGGGYGGAMY